MSRLSVPRFESTTGATAEIYSQIKKAIGSVPNTYAAIGAHGPAALKAMLAADAVLASGTLTKRDQETIKIVISGVTGCDYCEAAHSLLGKLAGLSPMSSRRSAMASPLAMPSAMRWSASSARSRKQVVPSATTTSQRSRPRDTPTRSWWISVSLSPRSSSPTSSTASTTPRSTTPQSRKATASVEVSMEDYDNEHAHQRHTESVCRHLA
jgi:AhpD family alkylhydroperoxidase